MPNPRDARPAGSRAEPRPVIVDLDDRPAVSTPRLTSTRSRAIRHALSRMLRTARHSASGSMCAHAGPQAYPIWRIEASRSPATISPTSSSTRTALRADRRLARPPPRRDAGAGGRASGSRRAAPRRVPGWRADVVGDRDGGRQHDDRAEFVTDVVPDPAAPERRVAGLGVGAGRRRFGARDAADERGCARRRRSSLRTDHEDPVSGSGRPYRRSLCTTRVSR